MILGAWISMVIQLGLVFIPNLYVKYVLMALFGLMFFKNLQTYILATEYVPLRSKVAVTTVLLGLNSMYLPVTAFYFKFISQDWRYIYYVYTLLAVIATILTLFLPESPHYLYEKEKYSECRLVVNKMAKMNSGSRLVPGCWVFDKESPEKPLPAGVNFSQIGSEIRGTCTSAGQDSTPVERSSEVELQVNDKESPWKIMKRNPVIAVNLMIIMFSWVATSFNNYLLSFSIRNFGGDLYFNAWAFGFAGLLGKFVGGI